MKRKSLAFGRFRSWRRVLLGFVVRGVRNLIRVRGKGGYWEGKEVAEEEKKQGGLSDEVL